MSIKLCALRLLALLGLAVSTVSLVDQLSSRPLFCGFESGCNEVMRSAFGRVAGVPLPVVGVVAFGLFFALSLFPNRPAGRLLAPLALLAGAAGLALLLVQVLVLKRLCRLCLVVDACALFLAVVELGLPSSVPQAAPARRWPWVILAALAVALPPVWSLLKPPPPVPEAVKAHWVDGKVTVVLVTDFDCPACRETHPILEAFLREKGDDVRLVRFVYPLPQHANARHAARAYWCANAQGKGDSMAQALFGSNDLSPEGCERIAAGLGLDLKRYRPCVTAATTDEAIDATSGWAPQSGLRGLPLVWIQDQALAGAQTPESLRAAFERASRKR
ncbi:MAG: thioredoxin domain-containing protein [Planctomycetes bacterium]|nr:thioredoxin domain-containing protein [Planctomycetota bacterium]